MELVSQRRSWWVRMRQKLFIRLCCECILANTIQFHLIFDYVYFSDKKTPSMLFAHMFESYDFVFTFSYNTNRSILWFNSSQITWLVYAQVKYIHYIYFLLMLNSRTIQDIYFFCFIFIFDSIYFLFNCFLFDSSNSYFFTTFEHQNIRRK